MLQRFPVDPQKLVFAGHSMGGYTIFNAYNQVSVKPVAMIVYSTGELNFKRGHPYFSAAQLAAIKVPLLLTYGEDEFDANKGPYAKEIQHLYGGPTEIMMIKGGGHLSYNDPAHWWGKKKRLQQIEVVFNRSREFLQKILQ